MSSMQTSQEWMERINYVYAFLCGKLHLSWDGSEKLLEFSGVHVISEYYKIGLWSSIPEIDLACFNMTEAAFWRKWTLLSKTSKCDTLILWLPLWSFYL